MTKIYSVSFIAIAFAVITGCSSAHRHGITAHGSAISVTPYSEVEWGALNPARGDDSPRAGTLWGDRAANTASGFLVQFKDGFSSPPHIHNVTYRGIVLSGLVHNDDPAAAKMWMPAGSYWAQPKGEAHITAAKGSMNIAYIEIDDGPYLVRPTDQSYDSGERPINIDTSNIVWLDSTGGVQIAHLWGRYEEGESNGVLIKIPQYFHGILSSKSLLTRAVVIQGQLNVSVPSESSDASLEAGSAFESSRAFALEITNNAEQECVVYVRSLSTLTVSSE